MSTNTNDPGTDAGAEPALESRVLQRRAELIYKLGELKPDMRLEAIEARVKVKAALAELAHVLKWGIVDGWASLGDPVALKLEQWLVESARQLASRREQP
jgi:hypothetical protein